jgi:ectoine hydroxylase-related dioxygenase (phytanoyl-CoA dioxygenase family)
VADVDVAHPRPGTGAVPDVSEVAVRAFEEDGAVCLRGVYGPHWIRLIEAGIERDLVDPGPYARVQSEPDDPGFFFTDYYMWRRIPELRRFALEGPGGAIAARLTRSTQINYFYDGLFVKTPGTVKPTLWHQDQPYYNVDGMKLVIMWIPVDPVPRETCLQLVGGSHRWGRWFVPKFIKGDRILAGAPDRYEPVPDIDAERDRYTILAWDLEPGDCIAFHPMMLHGAPGNASPQRRRAISTTWLGDDAVYGERQAEVEPRIEGHAFRPGERLTVEAVFPRVWPRAA